MNKTPFSLRFLLTMLALALCFPAPGFGAPRAAAKAAGGHAAKAASTADPNSSQINAKGAVLVEVSTGTVLFEQNADEVIEPASFTKIMTLYLVFQALQQGTIHLDDEVWVSEEAWRTGGSKMFVGVGSKVPLEELIKGIAVVSGNDACVAVAEHILGSVDAFVDAMNQKAKELGMTQTHFMNPHGLPAEGQVTSARDMAILDQAYLKRFPESLRFHSMREFVYNNINQSNRNHLLFKDPTVDGLKTGFVGAAGYHLAATSQRDGMRLLAVVMGAASPAVREREALRLLNTGYRQYTLVQPFPQGQPLSSLTVWKGLKDKLDLFPADAPSFLILVTQKNQLRWEVHAPQEVTAPVTAQQSLGEVVFYVSDQPKKSVALVSHEDIAQAGFFKRTWQSVLRVNKLDWRWVGGIVGGICLIGVVLLLFSSRRSRRSSLSH